MRVITTSNAICQRIREVWPLEPCFVNRYAGYQRRISGLLRWYAIVFNRYAPVYARSLPFIRPISHGYAIISVEYAAISLVMRAITANMRVIIKGYATYQLIRELSGNKVIISDTLIITTCYANYYGGYADHIRVFWGFTEINLYLNWERSDYPSLVLIAFWFGRGKIIFGNCWSATYCQPDCWFGLFDQQFWALMKMNFVLPWRNLWSQLRIYEFGQVLHARKEFTSIFLWSGSRSSVITGQILWQTIRESHSRFEGILRVQTKPSYFFFPFVGLRIQEIGPFPFSRNWSSYRAQVQKKIVWKI